MSSWIVSPRAFPHDAQTVASGTLLIGPVVLSVSFYLARPKSLPKKVRQHAKRPDLDKLIRGATDALTGIVWKDDAQVVTILATKAYASTDAEAPRAEFEITEVA